jgi:hypothetical protein
MTTTLNLIPGAEFTAGDDGTIAAFISPNVGVSLIPSGAWTFTFYAQTNGTTDISVRIAIVDFDVTETYIVESDPVSISQGATLNQYTLSVSVPEYMINPNHQLFVAFNAVGITSGDSITLLTDGTTQSKVVTTITNTNI